MILRSFLKVYSGKIRIIQLKIDEGKAGFEELFRGFEEDVPNSLKERVVISIHLITPYMITALIAREN